MKTSELGVAFIANEEGWVPHRYVDFAGVPTIGYGHAIKDGESFPERLSVEEGIALLARDLEATERDVEELVTVELNQNEFDALVSLVFNIGRGHFASSTVLRKLNEDERVSAADAFLMWDKARIDGKLQVSGVLGRRRRRERDVFLRPDG